MYVYVLDPWSVPSLGPLDNWYPPLYLSNRVVGLKKHQKWVGRQCLNWGGGEVEWLRSSRVGSVVNSPGRDVVLWPFRNLNDPTCSKSGKETVPGINHKEFFLVTMGLSFLSSVYVHSEIWYDVFYHHGFILTQTKTSRTSMVHININKKSLILSENILTSKNRIQLETV